jgi:hypothetical protein
VPTTRQIEQLDSVDRVPPNEQHSGQIETLANGERLNLDPDPRGRRIASKEADASVERVRLNGARQWPAGVHAGRSRLHAPRELLAQIFRDRDDPDLARDRLGQERRLRLRTLPLGARLGHWPARQAARVEMIHAAEVKEHAKEDLAGDIVARAVEDTTVERSA